MQARHIIRATAAGVFVAMLGIAVVTSTGTSYAVSDRLPNITPLPASDLAVAQSSGKTYLRFSTTTWNNGTGPLEIIGGTKDKRAGKQHVIQRIYNDAGGYRDVQAGVFTYHKNHRHTHFDNYATYILQPVADNGASDRTSQKTSFCIMDTDHIDPALSGSPANAAYSFCNPSVQGMSVGWGDKYSYGLDGQAVDITGLPDGDYTLTITVDPLNRITESNDSDNVSTIVVRKAGNSVVRVQ